MVMRKALADKILLLGIDGFEPRFTKKMLDMGLMPNTQKFIEQGAQREDLVMLGGHPTVTPPMWTTLATGCYANVHGITGFFRHSDTKPLDTIEYNMDSRLCKAEQLWNVFAEAGKKTLVWNWPGSSWPPSSDSPNLLVVDGSAPGPVASGVAQVEEEFILAASADIPEVTFKAKAAAEGVAPCVLHDLNVDTGDQKGIRLEDTMQGMHMIIYKRSQMSTGMTESPVDLVQSSLKPAVGWLDAPADALEFTLLQSQGLIRRVGLLLKGEAGQYDHVALYKNKKEKEPYVVLQPNVMAREVIDEAIKADKRYQVNRNMKLLNIDADGRHLTMWVSAANDIACDSVYSPKRLHKELVDSIGFPPPVSSLGCQDPMLITDCMLDCWTHCADWQAAGIHKMIELEKVDVIFSHFHNVDAQEHMFLKHLANKDGNRHPVAVFEKFMEDIYKQTDEYIGKFLHLLDEGWTVIIMSDHGLVASPHEIPLLAETVGVSVSVMEELGYTVLKTDEKGEKIGEIDWDKTRAIVQRDGHLYINLKGRETTGIVDPLDKYELEEQIMTDLYGYRDKATGKRVVSVALRNKDAVLLGQGGPEAGDICLWLAEGYNNDHADSLSTTYGAEGTSVSPIFIAAGKGLKKGYTTDRIIRQIDFAPTVAVLGGVRMPKQCEGAPVYQILAEEY